MTKKADTYNFRGIFTGVAAFFASFVLAALPFSSRLNGHIIPRTSAWCLAGEGLGMICLIYFLILNRYDRKTLSVLSTALLSGIALYNNLWDFKALGEVPHQICQGYLFLSIAFLSWLCYRSFSWENTTSKTIWLSVCLFEIYNFFEFLFYKICFGLPSIVTIMAMPNTPQAVQVFGWKGHYVPVVVILSVGIILTFRVLSVYRRFTKIDFDTVSQISGWYVLFEFPDNLLGMIWSLKNMVAHLSIYDANTGIWYGYKRDKKPNGKKYLFKGTYLNQSVTAFQINLRYHPIFISDKNLSMIISRFKDRKWSLLDNCTKPVAETLKYTQGITLATFIKNLSRRTLK